MSETKQERQVAKKGFGTVMVNRLREVDFASTEELAKLAGVTVEQAYSRLMFLQSQEKMVVSAGKGAAKVWSMADKAPPPAPAASEPKREEGVAANFNRNHGWKPSLRRYEPITEETQLGRGAKLLIEYPEGWRHTAFVSLTRVPDSNGVAQAWDLRNKVYAYVPVTPAAAAKYGCKIVKVNGEKDAVALENE